MKAEQDCGSEPREKLVYRLFFSGGMRIKMVYGFVGWNAIDRNIQKQVACVTRPRPGFAPNVGERSVGVFVGTRYMCAYLVRAAQWMIKVVVTR